MKRLQDAIAVVLMCSAFLLVPVQGMADSGSKTPDSIPLFAGFLEKDKEVLADAHALSGRPMASRAASASRIAQVTINSAAIDAQKIAPGAVVSINLFDNTSLEAEIDKVEVSNKITTIRGEIKGSDYGHIITTVYENKVLTVIELPAEGYQYKIVYDNDVKTHFLYKTKLSELDTLEGAPSLIPPPLSNDASKLYDMQADMMAADTPATIDVMVVYTPAAASWAAGNGGINKIISQAMARAQLALDNSNTSMNMRLVHSAQVAYTESGSSSTDLSRLQGTDDGFMDNVHTLRNQYGADIVTLFTNVNDTGGIGYLLQSKSGRPTYAFNIVRVQQAASSSTHIHEMGHNMGAHHHKQQTIQPGPTNWGSSWAANTWSAGWRWDDNSAPNSRAGYCSLMSYDSGYPDGKTYYRVDHFSNPGISYGGVATGDAANGDNARTLREIRNVIAGYRTAAAPECTRDDECDDAEVCSNNTCVECADDGDCTDGTCESNVCIPYECTVDVPCPGEEVCFNHTCVECIDAGDCDGGDVCSNNTCVECANNIDCDGGDVCSNNTCVECAKNTDCIDGTCESNVCIPYECTQNADCTGEEVCVNNKCVECANATDCDDGQFCNGAERCTGGTCFSGTKPCEAGELCNEDTDQCVEPAECAVDGDCTVGVCVDEVCVECRIDGDCSGEVCSDNNVCVECAVDADCTGGGVCSQNICVECVGNEDCIDGVCRGNVCVECVVAGDCPSNICLANKCIDCVSDFDCHGDVCLDNFCVECAHDDDCSEGICLDNLCTGCDVDADCERGTCIDNMCVVEGSVQIGKFTVKAGKNGKGDSLKFSGLLDASGTDFNEAWGDDVIVTIEAENIPDPALTTFTFPIKNDYWNNYKYKSPKVTLIDKSAPVSSLQIDTMKGTLKFSGKNLDLTGLGCPMTLTIQIGMYTAEKVLDEAVVNGTKPCPPELMMSN